MKMDVGIFLLMFSVTMIDGAKILIHPFDAGFNSRLMNMVKIADILNENGHNATVLVNNKVDKQLRSEHTNLTVYTIPNADKVMLLTDQAVLQKVKNLNFWDLGSFFDFFIDLGMPFCRNVLGTDVVHRLKAEQYDLVIVDVMSDCSRVLIDYLDIPAITYSNWGFLMDSKIFYPYIPSFVCHAGFTSCYSGKMNFQERLANVLESMIIYNYAHPKFAQAYDSLKKEFNLNITRSMTESMAYRAPVIVNGDFVLDYPRPLMPHIIMLNGLFYKKPKPLPVDIASFVADSAPHGLVVVSFGTLVPKVDSDKAEILAKVLGRLQQKVLWRHTGKTPKALKNNTKLVGWFPQADVLANPLTTMFITHCGISATYEAALNGLPVLAMPMFADQEYNARKLVERGRIGIKLHIDEMTEQNFEDTVKKVLIDPTFRRNAQHVASLLKDQDMAPRQKLLYWIDYVIRHNGARHLISETALSMGSMVYYSLDVFLFLFVALITLVALATGMLYLCLQCIRNYLQMSKKKNQ